MSKKMKKKQEESVLTEEELEMKSAETPLDEEMQTLENDRGVASDNANDKLTVEMLEERIEMLELENARTKDSVLRKAAEMENMQKRLQREKAVLFEDAKIRAFNDFLPVYDDLSRAIAAGSDTEASSDFYKGVQLVLDKFDEILRRNHIETIDETDIPFDVELHDALLRQPAAKKDTPSNTVTQILERGYRMGNRIISHAKVIVSE